MEKLFKCTSKTSANSTFTNFSKLDALQLKKLGKSKTKSELRFFPNLRRFLPFLTTEKYSSSFLNNEKSSQELQRTLSFNKNKVLKNKEDIKDLKIQYSKLQEENEFSKKILSDILNLDDDSIYTKEDILKKIKNCKKENDKKIVIDTLNLMNLKFEINEKKSILKSKNNEYNLLKQNSKYKNYLEMQKQLKNNDDIKIEILSDLEKLKTILEGNKKILEEKESEYKRLNKKYKNLLSEEKNIFEETKEKKGKFMILRDLISKLEQKLQKKEIEFKQYCRTKSELINSIEEKEKLIKKIKEFLSKKEQMNSNLLKKKEIIKDLEQKNNELEKEYNKLNDENNEIAGKIGKNENIYKKIDRKLNQDKKYKTSIKSFENNLKKIKSDFESIKNEYQNKIKNLNEINIKYNEDINNNKNIIIKKKEVINNLKNQKAELEIKIQQANEKLKDIENNIITKKEQIIILKNEDYNQTDLVNLMTE